MFNSQSWQPCQTQGINIGSDCLFTKPLVIEASHQYLDMTFKTEILRHGRCWHDKNKLTAMTLSATRRSRFEALHLERVTFPF